MTETFGLHRHTDTEPFVARSLEMALVRRTR